MLDEIQYFLKRWLTPAVRGIFLINIGIFLAQHTLLLLLKLNEPFLELFAQVPYDAISRFQIWRFVTYMFLHVGPLHLLFNMLALWYFAPRLESRWGSKEFLKFYFICGVGAAIVHAIFTFIFGAKGRLPSGEFVWGKYGMIGASGAIYGVLLAYAMYWPNETVLLNFFIPMKIKYMVILFCIMEFIGTIGAAGSGISHITHLGGLLTAFLYLKGGSFIGRGGFFRRGPKKLVKRYYRDNDGRIYIEFDKE
ncbi:rhomboid family intramembrane serine protease [Candidatus Sumerlaeota bacterium]|nr:rhomboid family intramembrane serine protease [Candidatus Sumerlaeota bacterium]